MSFRKPTSTTIRSYHFRENVYTFPVESVIESKPKSGGLRITASAGYQLTAAAHSKPQSELIIPYAKQADGSYVARNAVTLQAPGPAFLSGSVTLLDPLGESMTLSVHIDTLLTVDDSPILFNEIEPGDEAFAILKIGQYGADTPAVVSIDGSDYFTLAPGRKEPKLTATLTLTPTYTGTYIYIRYAPEKVGRHTATLLVDTPYKQQLILLEGRSIWGSSWYRLPQRVIFRTLLDIQDRLPPVTKAQKAGIGAVFGLAVLATGYLYRCELVPGWCQPETSLATASNGAVLSADTSGNLAGNAGATSIVTLPLAGSSEYPWIGTGENTGGNVKRPDSIPARPKRPWRTLAEVKPVDTVQRDSTPAPELPPAPVAAEGTGDSVSVAKPPVVPPRRTRPKPVVVAKADSGSAPVPRPIRPKRKRRLLPPAKSIATANQESDLEKELNRKATKVQ